jgi:hypothetical protein
LFDQKLLSLDKVSMGNIGRVKQTKIGREIAHTVVQIYPDLIKSATDRENQVGKSSLDEVVVEVAPLVKDVAWMHGAELDPPRSRRDATSSTGAVGHPGQLISGETVGDQLRGNRRYFSRVNATQPVPRSIRDPDV